MSINVGALVAGDASADLPLQPFDQIVIKELPEWSDQASISIVGEVRFPGIYPIRRGETHALMGPNGSGKSTLGNAIMGHPKYVITGGALRYRGQDLTEVPVHERARRGIFLCFQYPTALPGVQVCFLLDEHGRHVAEPQLPIGMRDLSQDPRFKPLGLAGEARWARRP